MTPVNPDSDLLDGPGPGPDGPELDDGVPARPSLTGHHRVTAVLVAHDGQRWLPEVLDAISAQERRVDRLLAADTGSRDATATILTEALAHGVLDALVTLPRDTGFGTAVARALRGTIGQAPVSGDPVADWLWLLHDDLAPGPAALFELLLAAEGDPQAAILGPKLRGWADPRLLREAGFSVTRGGRRWTGLDRTERDQGQHDGTREVLAVSTAGMLVRRDVWESLGGLDPALPFFRDDLDLCWRAWSGGHHVLAVTDAVGAHAEALGTSRRLPDAGPSRAHRSDRAAAVFTMLADVPAWRVPLTILALLTGTAVRSLGYLLAKVPGLALDELAGALGVLARPGRLRSARRRRASDTRSPWAPVRGLLAPRWAPVRLAVETLGSGLVGPGRLAGAETAELLDERRGRPARRVLTRPGVLVVLGLVLVTLVAGRDLIGHGRLVGGALLPAPDGARALWASYVAGWHPVWLGSTSPAPPYLAVLALVGTVLLGKASAAVELVVFGAVPMAGWGAYVALGRLSRARALRVWGAVAYALTPTATGALAAGRLGTLVAVALLPWLALAARRVVTGGPGGRSSAGLRAAWGTGLLLAVLTAFVPLAWVLAAVLATAAAVTVLRGWRSLRLLVVLAVPLAVLLPWTVELIRSPRLLLLEAGLPGPGLSDPHLSPVAVLLAHPGGPGTTSVYVTVGLLAGGLAALLRPDRRRAVGAAWAVVGVGLVAGLVQTRLAFPAPGTSTSMVAWPGLPTAMVAGGLVAACVLAAQQAGGRLGRRSFGWRQPLVVLVVLAAVAAPVATGAWWVARGAGGPLTVRTPGVVPANVVLSAEGPLQTRTLMLSGSTRGALDYQLVRGAGPRLGDGDVVVAGPGMTLLDAAVAGLASGRGRGTVGQLASAGVGYVAVLSPVDPALASVLDATPGLDQVASPAGGRLWALADPGSRASIRTAASYTPVPAGVSGVRTTVPGGPSGRLLVLAESRAHGWQATLDGVPLAPTTVGGWAQAFRLPATGGTLDVRFVDPGRRWSLVAQLALLLVVVTLALPAARRPGAQTEDPDLPPARPVPVAARSLV